ncbi:magnesium-translocating P-type ATPase [Tissierella creatinophila]|uniref:Magnesium-transporting ATPase, P-type 1 n=1 Tax=Tissierella creatinophila DSM 6911 TaxID=1123403 RepID=A0A1U7M629_TISCR|nr:magnesium-translocating P-type ATPase [Tissierella creatinophila]OLS02773.1 magnesium-transporting ATPase, P-type 1 [Tissierella creatinophila DSM 6911]
MEDKKSIKYWSMSSDKVLEELNLTTDGLSSEDAKLRLQKYGENSIKDKKKTSGLILFLSQFKNPIIIILIIATLISAATGEWIDALIILAIVLGSAILSFFQEYSASNAIEKLRAKVQAKTIVLRDGKLIEIPSIKVVPGDIIKLSAGSLIPADGLILESLDFFVNQSVLTGESLPSEKESGIVAKDASMEERINCVFMGTNVHSGSATVMVIETGSDTEFGEIAKKLTLRPPETDFESGVRHFGYLLTKIMLILTLTVFAINVIFKRPPIDSLLFSVALAVGITPQLLPAIISITLSMGSRSMAKAGVIVRRLNAIENFGSMDVLCTDKTGTLTEGTIRLDGAMDFEGQSSDDVFRLAYINAKLQIGMTNSLDQTIIDAKDIDISNVKKQGEIAFDFTRKRLSVIVQDDNKTKMIVKGAFSSVLDICNSVQTRETQKSIDDTTLAKIQKSYADWSNQGIRVLGIAEKIITLKEKYVVEDEKDMVFMGFLLLFDHPKADVSKTIVELENKGVSLRIITGDNRLVATHTAQSVGLKVSGILTGSELMKLSDEALLNKIETTNLFAEVDPNQKERIIMTLKKRGHVVGYMGDGINDVPALYASDVSISVDNAVDVAKESADFVLMENSLKVLNNGIQLGRTTFSNTLKYILVTTSANFGNMFSMAGASLFLPFLPLLPKQILMINFLTDFPAINIARDSVDSEILEKPRRWDIGFIKRFMITFGLISSVFDYLTFTILFVGFKAQHGIFQSSWFVFSILTELLILLIMRTQKPFYKSKPAPILIYSVAIVGAITLILPYVRPINKILDIEPIRPLILIALFGIIVMYIITTETAKHYFYKSKWRDNNVNRKNKRIL